MDVHRLTNTVEIDGTGKKESNGKKTNTFGLQSQLCAAVLLLILFILVSPMANINYISQRLVQDNSTLSQEIESINLPLQIRLCGISCGINNNSSCEQIHHYHQEILDAGVETNNATSDEIARKRMLLDFLLFCLPLQFREDAQIEQWIFAGIMLTVLLITAAFFSLVSLICLAASQRKDNACTSYSVSKMLKEVAAWLLLLASVIYPALTNYRWCLYSTEYYVFLVLSLGIWVQTSREKEERSLVEEED